MTLGRTVSDGPAMATMNRVAGNNYADVFIVNIESNDYIIVLGSYKAAICPKVKP